MTPSLPTELARTLAQHNWERIAIGQSKAEVYRLRSLEGPDKILKILTRDRFLSLHGEAARLQWLHGKLPVPEVIDFVTDATRDYLLMLALPGTDATAAVARSNDADLGGVPSPINRTVKTGHSPTAAGLARTNMAELLADALRLFHSVPCDGCPFRFSVADGVADAKAILEAGRVAVDSFDPENLGRDPHEMFEELVSLQPQETAEVFTHGDYCLPNVIVDRGALSGFIDFGRAGVGDVHRDLAIASRSIEGNLGPEAVDRFFHRYGIPNLDPARLRFFRLLDEFV